MTEGTPYTVLYDSCLARLKSYDFMSLTDEEVYEVISDYLRPAIVMYTNCTSDLSDRDDIAGHFYYFLTDTEIEVLSKYMLVCFLDANYICVPSMMKSNLSSRDFNTYSNANLLEKITKIRDAYLVENKQIAGRASYRNSELFALE